MGVCVCTVFLIMRVTKDNVVVVVLSIGENYPVMNPRPLHLSDALCDPHDVSYLLLLELEVGQIDLLLVQQSGDILQGEEPLFSLNLNLARDLTGLGVVGNHDLGLGGRHDVLLIHALGAVRLPIGVMVPVSVLSIHRLLL